MRIRAFHIRNYRSIVDSGNCFLSHDNITALIGQNESGKTSVLEALKSFYEGEITDDVLRSDQTFPEITCLFELEGVNLEKLIDINHVPNELHDLLRNKQEISLTRKWVNAKKSFLSIAGPEILEFFDLQRKITDDTDRKIKLLAPDLLKLADTSKKELNGAEEEVADLRSELNKCFSRLEDAKRILSKARKSDMQYSVQQELSTEQERIIEIESKLKERLTFLDERKTYAQEIAEKLNSCQIYNDLMERLNSMDQEVQGKMKQIHESEHQYELCSSEKDSKVLSKKIEQLKADHGQLINELKDITERLSFIRKRTGRILDGKNSLEAETEATKETELEKNYYSPEVMGNLLFRHLPQFEFFEDFSSLLPNKIDLEDLLNENTHAEGYKAARNFLGIAGLSAEFFREKNHRILKQKIENLNSELTIDFQDYWRQSVGNNDKIRLNFELEHYDYTVPEKSGKPYLEFWVKDKLDRLYPKQRSRGVRWFLSFYLELKATAKQNHRNRVMLIDEPGLSLHARAQEDVLKVFEDLKDQLQIIYSTHSPYLIDLHKLYRVLAVQRAQEGDEKSETIVLDNRSFHEASSDTLSPIYSLMGTRLNDRQFIYPRDNIIVEDAVTYYYLDCMAKLFGYNNQVHFIPSTSIENIPLMANLLFGWKIDFNLLMMDNPASQGVLELIRKTMFLSENESAARKIRCFEGFQAIEDLFSTIDFKKFILHQRLGITETNSTYMKNNRLSRIILATDFCTRVQKENVQLTDFDEETQSNFVKLFCIVNEMIEEKILTNV
jgi:predicted ATP-dependent endonuclease of OLD family